MLGYTAGAIVPRDWRDYLARAINDRDLPRIEALIELGQQCHHHTNFNDPLIADATYLLQLAQNKAQQQQQQQRLQHARNSNSNNNHSSTATTATAAPHRGVGAASLRTKLVAGPAGGASWVAPAVASIAQSLGLRRSGGAIVGESQSLRDRVSQLREMALFPGGVQTRSQAQLSPARGASPGRRGAGFVQRPQQATASLGPDAETQEAAAAMGVPLGWVEPARDSWPYAAAASPTRSASSPASQQVRSVAQHFEDRDEIGAALRLHSFVHAEEEPAIKSSRLYHAFVSRERVPAPAPAAVSSTAPRCAPKQSPSPPPQQQQPARASSPEHDRLVRKLRHESTAPDGVEVTRMMRFLAATATATASATAALDERTGQQQGRFSPLRQHGMTRSLGVSVDHDPRGVLPAVFMDN